MAPCGVSTLSPTKLRHREAEELLQGSPASPCWGRDLNPGCGLRACDLHTTLLPRWAMPHAVSPSSRLCTGSTSVISRSTPAPLSEAPRVLASVQHHVGYYSLSRYFGALPHTRAVLGQARV